MAAFCAAATCGYGASVVLVSDVTRPTSIGLLVAGELEPAELAPPAGAVLAADAVLPADPELDVPPELLQAVTVTAAATIAATDAALTRLAGSQLLRDSTLSPPIDGATLNR
jgi:hypothetical protein